MRAADAPQPRWEAVLFDLDGTLADTVPLILASFHHTMMVHRGRRLPDREWLQHVGRPLRDTVKQFARDQAEAASLLETYLGFQRDAHDRMVRPFDGIGVVVGRFVEWGVPMAIVTSKAREMTFRTLQSCGVAEAFPVVITADDVEHGKPDPEPVRRALHALGSPPADRTLFVGDSPHDVTAGRRAGVRTVAVTWGAFSQSELEASSPDHVVQRPQQLLKV